MTTVEKDEFGVSNINLDGDEIILSYMTTSKEYHFHGSHEGQITGKSITIEIFDTEQEMMNRIDELGIDLPDEA